MAERTSNRVNYKGRAIQMETPEQAWLLNQILAQGGGVVKEPTLIQEVDITAGDIDPTLRINSFNESAIRENLLFVGVNDSPNGLNATRAIIFESQAGKGYTKIYDHDLVSSRVYSIGANNDGSVFGYGHYNTNDFTVGVRNLGEADFTTGVVTIPTLVGAGNRIFFFGDTMYMVEFDNLTRIDVNRANPAASVVTQYTPGAAMSAGMEHVCVIDGRIVKIGRDNATKTIYFYVIELAEDGTVASENEYSFTDAELTHDGTMYLVGSDYYDDAIFLAAQFLGGTDGLKTLILGFKNLEDGVGFQNTVVKDIGIENYDSYMDRLEYLDGYLIMAMDGTGPLTEIKYVDVRDFYEPTLLSKEDVIEGTDRRSINGDGNGTILLGTRNYPDTVDPDYAVIKVLQYLTPFQFGRDKIHRSLHADEITARDIYIQGGPTTTFTTVDGKTVTVRAGIITNIA